MTWRRVVMNREAVRDVEVLPDLTELEPRYCPLKLLVVTVTATAI
jgi:hypothetical protein